MPIDYKPQKRSSEDAPPVLLPGSFGQAPLQAAQEVASVVNRIGKMTTNMAGLYAEKNKKADMDADAISYRIKTNDLLTAANTKASGTVDQRKIDEIYTQSYKELEAWVSGNNKSGLANVRDEKQQQRIKLDAEEQKLSFMGLAENRKHQMSRNATIARAEQSIFKGVRGNQHELIDMGIGIMVDNGLISAEKGELLFEQKTIQAEQNDAASRIKAMAALPPELAEKASEDFKEELKAGAYSFLTEDEKAEFEKLSEVSVQQSRNHVERERRHELAKSSDTILEYQLEHEGNIPTMTDVEALGLAPEHNLEIMQAWKKTETGDFNEIYKTIQEFDRNDPEKNQNHFEIQLQISTLDAPYKAMALDLWKLQAAPGKDTEKLGADQIMKVIGGQLPGVNEKKVLPGEKPFGEFINNVEQASLAASTLDRYYDWVKQEPRTDADIVNWIDNDPVIGNLRAITEKKAFRRAYYGETSTPVPTLHSSQLDYMDDDDAGVLGDLFDSADRSPLINF